MLKSLQENLFDFDRPETTGELLFFRLYELLIGYWVLSFSWTWAPYIGSMTEVVLPLGAANYMDISFFFEGGRALVLATIVTVGFVLGFTRIFRGGYLIALAALHLLYASRYSLGEISHGSNVIGVALMALAVSAFAFRDRLEMRRFALGLTLFLLGFGYTSAAFCKLIATGPSWVDGSHLWMWIGERAVDTYSMSGTLSLNALQEIILESYPVATLILTFGLVTEFLGFLIWYRRSRTFVMLLLIAMHVGILFSMRINFPANNALLLAFALPWGTLLDRAIARLGKEPRLRLRHLLLRFA